MRDVTLDAFLTDDDTEADGGRESADDGPDPDVNTGVTLDSSTDPLVSTFRWTPGKEPCDACGAAVEERWRDGTRAVCGDCMDW